MRWLAVLGVLGGAGCNREDPTDTKPPGTTVECVDEVPYDGIDQDCDGSDLVDVDGDGFDGGDAGDDCDDGDPDVSPGGVEVPYDGTDQDCTGSDLTDVDADGHDAAEVGGADCDDADPDRSPSALEIWYDGIDQDCDGGCDFDKDGDGFAVPGTVPVDGDACDQDPAAGSVSSLDDCDDSDAEANDNRLVSLAPADGDVGVSLVSEVRGTLTRAEAGAVLQVTGPAGVLAGSTVVEGNDLVFTPAGPFAVGADYQIDMNWSCGPVDATFTAVDVGPANPVDLVGQSFRLDPVEATWIEPAPIITLFIEVSLDRSWLLGVVAADATSITVVQALTTELATDQDLCVETVSLGTWDFTANPDLSMGPTPSMLVFEDLPVVIEDTLVTGAFTSDGGWLADVVVTGEMDTRDWSELHFPFDGDDGMCDLAQGFGYPCQPCISGGDYCVDIRLEGFDGQPTGVPVVVRTAADIAADVNCP